MMGLFIVTISDVVQAGVLLLIILAAALYGFSAAFVRRVVRPIVRFLKGGVR